jgi:lipoprotein-releasing system ATP-binding protein
MDSVVRVTGLSKSYGHGHAKTTVLHGVDLEVGRGELVVVLGPSGTGKTSLLNILGLLDRPTEGHVDLFGQRTGTMTDDERSALRNQRIGYVFQFDSILPEFTVLENVMMPALIRRGASKLAREGAAEQARAILARFGMDALKDRWPQALSGGEKQRVAIARALMNGPELILADEPTGNLDSRNAERVFADMRQVSGDMGVAVVLVTHNEHAATFATRAYHLADGRLADVRRAV